MFIFGLFMNGRMQGHAPFPRSTVINSVKWCMLFDLSMKPSSEWQPFGSVTTHLAILPSIGKTVEAFLPSFKIRGERSQTWLAAMVLLANFLNGSWMSFKSVPLCCCVCIVLLHSSPCVCRNRRDSGAPLLWGIVELQWFTSILRARFVQRPLAREGIAFFPVVSDWDESSKTDTENKHCVHFWHSMSGLV